MKIKNRTDPLKQIDPDIKQKSNTYLRYSSLGFQLIAIMVIGYFLGNILDNRFNPGNPRYWTVGLMVVLTAGYLYKMVKDLTKKGENR